MVNRDLIGRCGLYCGACGIYRAYKDGEEFRRRLADVFKCPPEKVRCEGCQVLTSECWGNDCKLVNCLDAKGLQFCYECSEFERHTCEKFEELSKNSLKDAGVDLRDNLARIETGNADEWLRECEEKFRCSSCRKPLDSHARKCYHCGKDLSS